MEFIFVHDARLCVPATERDFEIGLCMCQVVYEKYHYYVYVDVYILRSWEQTPYVWTRWIIPRMFISFNPGPRVWIWNAPVCTFKTSSCLLATRPHVFYTCGRVGRYTRRRFECAPEGRLQSTHAFFFCAPHQIHRTPHTPQTKPLTKHTPRPLLPTDTTSTHTAQRPQSDREIECDRERVRVREIRWEMKDAMGEMKDETRWLQVPTRSHFGPWVSFTLQNQLRCITKTSGTRAKWCEIVRKSIGFTSI